LIAPARPLLAAALLLLCACGGGPQLTNLRCRETPCQDPEDPFKLRLAVDFADPSGSLGGGVLELLQDGVVLDAVTLGDLFTAQGIPGDATRGTLQVDEDLQPTTVTIGETVIAGLRAKNGDAQQSNTPSLSLTLSLGGN
jgi:hypothetical protein